MLGSEFVSDLVEGEHKKEEHKTGHKDEHKVEDLKGHAHHGRLLFSCWARARVN